MSLRPTFMGFEASKTAIFVSQKAIDIVGNNLANMSTEGYTRQRTDQVSVDNFAYKSRISNDSFNHVGMGTTLEGVSQMRDERMDTAFRNSYSETSYYSKSFSMYSDIENIITEIDEGIDGDGYGISWGLKQMYQALESLSNNTNIIANSTVFADAVNNITSLLNRTSATLAEACDTYKSELKTDVKDANDIIDEIAVLNKQIKDVMAGNAYTEQHGPNELFDKRNMLLDELSAYGKIDVKSNTNGTVTVAINGHECVKDAKADSLIYTEGNDGTVGVRWMSNGEDAAKVMGVLKASMEIINGRGLNVSEQNASEARGFKYYQDSLDSFASMLSSVLNGTIPDKVDPKTGSVISYKKLVGEGVYENGKHVIYNDRRVTAANISVSDELYRDPTYVLIDKNSSDNKYLLDLIGKLSTDQHTFINGAEKFSGTFQNFITEYAGKIGTDVKFTKSKYEACEQYSDELINNRENITGVSETEETINMLTYNRAFQAAAKMMTTMDELLDVVINQIGALG